MKKIILIVLVGFIIISCSAAKDASKVLRNEKTNSTDEFLVKQKQPLELPPDFNKIPLPNSKKKDTNENKKIQSILKAPKEINSTQRKSSSIEETIIDKIKNE